VKKLNFEEVSFSRYQHKQRFTDACSAIDVIDMSLLCEQ